MTGSNRAGWFFGVNPVDALWHAGPATDYILRTSMVETLWAGIGLLVAATNPEKQTTQVLIPIGGLLPLAIVTLAVGLANSRSPGWFLGDSVTSPLGAELLFAFRQAKARSRQAGQCSFLRTPTLPISANRQVESKGLHPNN